MKKILFFLILLPITTVVFSQNWTTFSEKELNASHRELIILALEEHGSESNDVYYEHQRDFVEMHNTNRSNIPVAVLAKIRQERTLNPDFNIVGVWYSRYIDHELRSGLQGQYYAAIIYFYYPVENIYVYTLCGLFLGQ